MSPVSRKDSPHRDIARISSLAEAGYLSSLLSSEGYETTVRHSRSFNATNGAWLTDYVLQTSEEDLAGITAILRREAEIAEREDEDYDARESDYDAYERVVWRPFALMALAGVVSFVAGQRFAEPLERPKPNPSLASAVDAIGQSFFTQSEGRQPIHRLQYDKRRRVWLLDTDQNGDGKFDRRRRFATNEN